MSYRHFMKCGHQHNSNNKCEAVFCLVCDTYSNVYRIDEVSD